MVTEKPPRRSMAEKEPVTIDLTADGAGVVAEPVRSNDSDIPETAPEKVDAAEITDASPLSDKPVTSTVPEETDTSHVIGEPDSSLGPDEPVVTEPAEPVVTEPDETVATDAARDAEPSTTEQFTSSPTPGFDEPAAKDETFKKAAAPPASRSGGTSASTLIAAGIFGGIVALLLAGSMQYAGYLPSSSPAASGSTELSDEIEALRQEIQTLRSQPASLDTELASRIQALESSVAQNSGGPTEESLNAIQQQLADTKAAAATQTAELSRRLEAAEAQINDRGPEQQVARAVAAAGLKAAIDRGGSFEAELQAYTNIAGDDPAIAELKTFSADGAPSREQLQSEFPAVADTIIQASVPADPDQGIASRLLSSAMSVVKVRRVGDVEGDTAEAIVSRIEDRLRNGDLPAAAQQWDTLPEAAKSASTEFKRKLDARVQVENLVSGTLSRALAGTKSGS
jgi:hypothetical protein